jgi:acyl carrier protein
MSAAPGQDPSWEEFKATIASATGLAPDALDRDRQLVEDLGLDSLQVAEVLVVLIEDYGLRDLLGELETRVWRDITVGQLYDEVVMRTGAS